MINLDELIDEIKCELDYKYDLLTPVTYEQIRDDYCYRVKVTTVKQAETFNYHSDYCGYADGYQEQNVTAMRAIKPYIGKVVEYGGEKVKLVAMLIDKQYNSIGHTDLLVEEVA